MTQLQFGYLGSNNKLLFNKTLKYKLHLFGHIIRQEGIQREMVEGMLEGMVQGMLEGMVEGMVEVIEAEADQEPHGQATNYKAWMGNMKYEGLVRTAHHRKSGDRDSRPSERRSYHTVMCWVIAMLRWSYSQTTSATSSSCSSGLSRCVYPLAKLTNAAKFVF